MRVCVVSDRVVSIGAGWKKTVGDGSGGRSGTPPREILGEILGSGRQEIEGRDRR